MPWLGRKKLALVPVYRPNARPPDQIPQDWPRDIERRMLFDPDPATGADRSLRAFINAASSGKADLDAEILPMRTIDQQDVSPGILEQRLGATLRSRGFDAAAIVMLGGPGAGTNHGYWSRFVMAEGVGVWAMEFLHGLSGFGDLYVAGGNMGAYDAMAGSVGTHPSAYTKVGLSWLTPQAVSTLSGRANGFRLHAVGSTQPPPSGRSTAVRIGAGVPYLMVEARIRADQFDRGIAVSGGFRNGIPEEGVIVYRVQTSDPLGGAQNNKPPVVLLTTTAPPASQGTALKPGQSLITDTNIAVNVTGVVPGGFVVTIDNRNLPFDSGRLLFYRVVPGSEVQQPAVIGLGGWQEFRHLFSGGDGSLYAVDADGRLLFYRDWRRDGTGDVSRPAIVGRGGWQQMRHLFPGGDGIIYAVDTPGRLLFYRDLARDGSSEVSGPAIIGQGGWQAFRRVFSCGDGIIYAVDDRGRLLRYQDRTRDGTGDVHSPTVVGQGGWQKMRVLFGGRGRRIYAVDGSGKLLQYQDASDAGGGEVSAPTVIGGGGWQVMKFVVDGGEGIIYAVRE